jgi:putative glutamine amidotransferase
MTNRILAYSPYGSQGGNIKPFWPLFSSSFNAELKGTVKGADALLLYGGEDIHPSFYGQTPHINSNSSAFNKTPSMRDMVEWHLMREAAELGIPLIGICRGAQFICVFAGGNLIQDVSMHRTSHAIKTFDGLSMHASAEHHQMMNPKAGTYELLAWADPQIGVAKQMEKSLPATGELVDKNIDPEVVWFPEVKGFAIQPHPEWMPEGGAFPNWCVKQVEAFSQTFL